MVTSIESRPCIRDEWEAKIRSRQATWKREGVAADPAVRELDRIVADLVRLTGRLGQWLDANPEDDGPAARPIRIALGGPDHQGHFYQTLEFVWFAMQQAGSGITSGMFPTLFPLATRADREDAAA